MKKTVKRILAALLVAVMFVGIAPMGVLLEAKASNSDGFLYNLSELPSTIPTYPEKGQKYWVVFNEGCRGNRLEMSTFDVEGGTDSPYIVWNGNLLAKSNTGSVSRSNQFSYTESEWIYDRNYGILSDKATKVFSSNVDVYDANGNILVKATIPEQSDDTVINFSENKKVVPIGFEFNVSAKYKSVELIPSAETISCTIDGENGGLTVNGSLSILGTKDNAVISASFKAKKIGDYKIIFSSSDGAKNSIDISIVSDTFDKYLASSLIELRKDKIQKTQMFYGYIYDGGLSIDDNLEAFVRVKDYRKGISYFYELVIMDLLLNSAKDDDFTDVLNSNAESIKDKLVSYGLKYNKYTSQTAFENAKISNLSVSEKEKINKAFNDSKVMCDAFSDMNTLIDGFNTINDYIQALSKYAALQNVKKGYIDVLKAILIHEMNLHGSGAGVDLNVVEFVAALDDIIEKYENYQISVADCFYDSASDLIWNLSKEVAGEIVEYIVGAEAAAIITITRETLNLIWQVFEPKELFVAESTLNVTKYIENELKSVLDNVAAQFNSSGELEHAILFNNCYEMLLSCFTYGNSIHSYTEDFRYEGTPAGIIGSLINSSKKVTHEEVCKRIEKSNEIVANEYSVIKNIAERYKSYIYDTNMIWEISLDYNVQLKRTAAPVLYDYSNTSITCTQCYYNGEQIDLTGKNPTRNGYEFSGWYYDKECTKKFVNMTKANSDLTLYAKWKPTAIYNVKDTKASITELNLNYMGSPFSTRSGSSETVANKDTYCIPAYIDGYEVVSIEDNIQIKNKNAIGTLYIPNTVTSVGKNAFENCENITTVIIPASVTTIADDAFNGCKNIEKVVYEGSKEQWDKINFGKNNDSIIDSKIKFNSSQDNVDSDESYSIDFSKLNVGDEITFGSYPQTEVTDATTLKNLNSLSINWSSYDYSYGKSITDSTQATTSDYMQYADIVYGGEKYRAVKMSQLRPSINYYPSSTTYSEQDDNGYDDLNKVYWFKYEPLKWIVLDSTSGLVMCKNVIDSQEFNKKIFDDKYGDSNHNYFANNYEQSSIRNWLNNDFYNIAFSSADKTHIEEKTLSNVAYDKAQFNSGDTTDKITLLSFAEYQKIKNDYRLWQAGCSNYALCQGVSSNSGNTVAEWMLRTAGTWSDVICSVSDSGAFSTSSTETYNSSMGIRPVVYLKTKNSESKPKVQGVSVGSDIKINYKKSETINYSVTADNGAEYTVSFSSSNPSVARVDDNGNVYGAKRGSATITCTVTDSNGNTVQDTCNVTVKYSFGQWLIVILLFGWIWY